MVPTGAPRPPYIPIADLNSGRWDCAEALLRWSRPGGEAVGAGELVPFTKQLQRMSRLTGAMLDILINDARAGLAQQAGQCCELW